MNRIIPLLSCTLLFAINCFAAVYYIDYENGKDSNNGSSKSTAWQRCPGMAGFAGSYSYAPGDIFIFKGGVTWPATTLPLTIPFSGIANAPIQYTTDHGWHAGKTWSQPILDGQGNAESFFKAQQKSYFVINDLHMINAGVAFPSESRWRADNAKEWNVGLRFISSDHFSITNNTIASERWHGIRIYFLAAKTTYREIEIAHNGLSHHGIGITVSVEYPGTILHGLSIHDNRIHDHASQLIDNDLVHGDGINIFKGSGVSNSDSSSYISAPRIYNNIFYGDWTGIGNPPSGVTALIYFYGGAVRNALIYNNAGFPSAGAFSRWIFFEDFGVGGGHQIFNNSFHRHQSVVAYTGIESSLSFNLAIKNNIISNLTNVAYIFNNTIGHNIDNNCVTTSGDVIANWNGIYKTWPEWQALGNDGHGTNQEPRFVSSSDLRLSAASPEVCKYGGANLAAIFSTDQNNHLRPTAAVGAASDGVGQNSKASLNGWSLGAYQTAPEDGQRINPASPNPPTRAEVVNKP